MKKLPPSNHINIKYYIHTYYPGQFYIVDQDEHSYLEINIRSMQKTKKYNWIVYYQKTEWCKTWIKEVDKETFYNAIDKELKSYANY